MQRKNIVFIIGEYYPNFSTNGNIANNVIEELKKDYNIIVITRRDSVELDKEYNYGNIKIMRINDYNLLVHNWLTSKIFESSGGFKRILYKSLLNLKRLFYFIYRVYRIQNVSNRFTNKIVNQLKIINIEQKIDIIIPVSFPQDAIMAAIKYKEKFNKSVKVFPYHLDHLFTANDIYESIFLRKIKYYRHVKLQARALKVCDKYYILPPIEKELKVKEFELYFNKIIVTGYPLVKRNELSQEIIKIEDKKEENKKISLVYAGALYTKLRNPICLFEIIKNMKEKNNITLNLYHFGNCQSIVEKYKKVLDNSLIDFGRVPMGEVQRAMRQSDILVSIGNNSTIVVPSKLFDYLSIGKPILHLFYNESDPYIQYLSSYKYSLCIKIDENMVEENAVKIYDFCNKNKSKSVPFGEVESMFYTSTPKYVAQLFIDEIEHKTN